MKALLLCAALLSACVSAPPTSPYVTARHQTVLVDVGDGHGTGVVLNDNCVLTADHVVNGEDAIVVQTDSGRSVPVKIALEEQALDIAVVCAAESLGAPHITFAKKMPEVYDEVFALGNPLNEHNVMTKGAYQGDSIITAQVAPGNSGGGVFDMQGRYIGFVDALEVYPSSRGMMVFPHLCIIVEIDKIATVLDAAHIGYTRE